MTQTLPIADLAELVAPLTAAEFANLLDARVPRHIPGAGGDGARYAALLDWDELVAGMRDSRFPPRDFRLMRDRVKVPPMFLRDGATPRGEIIDKLLATDASIILNRAERHVPSLGRLCSAIAGEVRDHVSAVAVATAGHGGALDLHYDPYDIVVLQVDGAKKWSIYADPVIDPVNAMTHQPPADENAAPALEMVLQPGDWLLVPAGWRHCCDTQSARSLHIGILLYPFTAARAVELILRDMIETPEDRAPMRFDDAQAATTEAALRRRIIDRVNAMPIGDLVRLHQSSGAHPARMGQPGDDPSG
jgi:hypothetical protein